MDLLFVLALFHGLAKLRLSTALTRDIFRAATADLGRRLRIFKAAADLIHTEELDGEAEKRQRGHTRAELRNKSQKKSGSTTSEPPELVTGQQRASKIKGKGKAKVSEREVDGAGDDGVWEDVAPADNKSRGKTKKKKAFTLSTYKVHELGHYVETVMRYGTLDIHSTQWASHSVFS